MSRCDAVVVEVTAGEVWVEVPGRAPACGSCKSTEVCRRSARAQRRTAPLPTCQAAPACAWATASA
jgi:positive regulator of sigma E activity